MSAHFLLYLLNKLGKRDKMRGLPSILSLSRNEFNKFNNTIARMLDSIYHMTNTLKSYFWRKNVIILSLCTQRCYGRHNVSRKSINHYSCIDIYSYSCLHPLSNIGITHVFSCINICRVPRMLFEHEADRPSVQYHPRDPASVNAMKQTCVIVILAYFTLFQPNSH